MRVEVYDTEGEALDAAAEHVAAALQAAAGTPLLAALPGERRGRALMTALASRDDVPWQAVRWCVTHEIVRVGPGDERSAELLRDEVLGPRRLPAESAVLPDPGDEAGPMAAAYAERLARCLGEDARLSLVCLTLASDGSVAGLGRCDGDRVGAAPLVVHGADVVSLSPQAIDAAAGLVVVATGSAVTAAVTRCLQAGAVEATGVPDVRPSARVQWFADRAAVADLLRTARPVDA